MAERHYILKPGSLIEVSYMPKEMKPITMVLDKVTVTLDYEDAKTLKDMLEHALR